MPDVLVVLTDRRRVAAAQAAVDGAQAHWTGGWTAAWPEGISPEQNPQAAGEWLKSQWSTAGLTAKSVWMVMSREDIVLRHLELPAAPDEELADLVRFQAAGRSAVPIDQLTLDFLPFSASTSRPGRDVLAATLANTVVERHRAMLKAADRELSGITFSSTAIAEWTLRYSRRREAEAGRADVSRSGAHALMASLTRRITDPNNADLTIILDGAKVELAVVAERQLVFGHAARTFSVPEEERQVPVQAEISRTIVTAQRLRPDLKLQHVWLVGGDAALAKSIHEQLGCAVETIDTLKATDLGECPAGLRNSPAEAITLAGALLARTSGASPNMDFVHPRQAPPKRDPRKLKMAVGAAAAMLGAFLIFGSGLIWLRSLESQIETLRKEYSKLDEKVRGGQRDLQAAATIADWDDRNIIQLKQMGEIEEALPGGYQRPYLSNYQYSVATTEKLASLKMSGAAKNRDDVDGFRHNLIDAEKYRVRPTENKGSRDDDYPVGFLVDADIVAVKKKPVANPAASASERSPK